MLATGTARDRPSPYGEGRFFIVARGTGPRDRWVARTMARDRPSPYGEVPFFIVARGTGPRDRRWTRCLPVFARPPRRDTYRNGVRKHPHDIADNRRRNQLAKLLEGFGYRVQRSVFEARLSTQTRQVSEPPRGLSAQEGEFSFNLLENSKKFDISVHL